MQSSSGHSHGNGELQGVRVIDFSTLLPGPLATLILRAAGAEVIKIERPGSGDEMRILGRSDAAFNLLNCGKKSVCCDLKNESQHRKLLELVRSCDVLVEQFRPGVMARLRLDYESLQTVNPGLIYCSITGYGQTGPRSLQAGHDLNYMADTGLLSLAMGGDASPVIPPALIADIAAGTYPAIINILLALRKRDRTGEGSRLDISMADGLFPFAWSALADGWSSGQWPANGKAMLTGGSPRYQLYPASDGGIVAVAALEQRFWLRFTDLIELSASLVDDAKSPGRTRDAVAQIISSRKTGYWRHMFKDADCCVNTVRTLEEAVDDPHFRARIESFRPGSHDSTVSGADMMLPLPLASEFTGYAASRTGRAPKLGEDNHLLDDIAQRRD